MGTESSMEERLRVTKAVLTLVAALSAVAPTSAATFTVDRLDDVAGASGCTSAPLDCSLRTAISLANLNPGPDEVLLPDGTVLLSLGQAEDNLNQVGDLDITDDLTIRGAAGGASKIDADTLGALEERGVLHVLADASLILENLAIEGPNETVFEPVIAAADSGCALLRISDTEIRVPSGSEQDLVVAQCGVVEILDSILEAPLFALKTLGLGTVDISDSAVAGGLRMYGRQAAVHSSTLQQRTVRLVDAGSQLLIVDSELIGDGGDWDGIAVGETDSLQIVDTIVRDFGESAIVVFGGHEVDIDIRRSSFLDNESENAGGGALRIEDSVGVPLVSVEIEDSAFVGNKGLFGNGGGGAIWAPVGGHLVIRNTTFAENEAPKGGAIGTGPATTLALTHVTLSDNIAPVGSAIHSDGSTTLLATLVDGTCSGSGSVTSFGSNLESPGFTCGLVQASDRPGVPSPLLGGLAYNDGPTLNRMPQRSSQARNALPICFQTTDQRGGARPFDGLCDIGAVEAGAVRLFRDGFESGDTTSWSQTFP